MSDLQQKVLLAVIGAALAGWLFPAITRQAGDRQKETELKSALVGELSQGATRAFSDARAIIRQVLPEAALRRQRQAMLRQQGVADASCADETLIQLCIDERRAESERILQARESWLQLSDALEARVAAYFSEDLERDLDEFTSRVFDYVRLSFQLRPEARALAVRRLESYLRNTDAVDFTLLEVNPRDARSRGEGRGHADEWEELWGHIQGRMHGVIDAILRADGRGFSTNYGDLACDLLFFAPFTPGCER